MLIDCPNCARSYPVAQDDIGSNGRRVVCPRCQTTWFVEADGTNRPPANDRALPTSAVSTRSAEKLRVRTRRRGLLRRAARVLAAAACVVLATGLIGARERIVRAVPQTATLYSLAGMSVNVSGLTFAELTPVRLDPTLPEITVSGTIRNVVSRRVAIPRVVYQARDAAGVTLVTWTEPAATKTVAAGRTASFASSPHLLPPESRTVVVRFETASEEPAPIRIAARTPEPPATP